MTSLIYLSNLSQKLLKPFGFELKFKVKLKVGGKRSSRLHYPSVC